jgi:hypothetical protein
MTLAEHDEMLKAEGRFGAMQEEQQRRETERLKKVEELRQAERPLVAELRAAGFAVDSTWQLTQKPPGFSRALPILLAHLQRQYPPETRAIIAQALAVPEARFAWKVLVDLFRREADKGAKDSIANAIAAIADDDLIADVIPLARDRTLGSSRVLLLRALEKSNDPGALETLHHLETDPDVHKEAQAILKRLQGKVRRKARTAARAPRSKGPEAKSHPRANLVEVSTSFDAEDLAPFLERIATLVQSGFGSGEIRRVVELSEELEVEESGELEFEVGHDGKTLPIKIRILMSDTDAPEIAFFAPHQLVAQIRGEIEKFAEERGM